MIKWVARLAVITALLGLAGTIIIISNIRRKQKDEKTVISEKKDEPALTNAKVDTEVIRVHPKRTVPLPLSPTAPVEKKETPVPKITPPVKQSEEKVSNHTVAKPDDEKKPLVKQEGKKEPEEKLFTPDELEQLVGRINRAREENSISSNCVQIHSTKQGNFARTIAQVETYLKSRRFAIAGREVVSKKIKGILINPVAGCIRITIGTF